VKAIPFARFLRLLKLCAHEQECQYRLHMEGSAFVSWMIHATNCAKPNDIIKFEKWREMLNLKPKEKINKQKELEQIRRNLAWMKKPIVFQEHPIEIQNRTSLPTIKQNYRR
jgi:hypothetical protein